MKKNIKSFAWIGIWVLLFLISGNFGLMGRLFSQESKTQDVTEDVYMHTNSYSTEITVQEDNSYLVQEDIQVRFLLERHGIYRYIPQKGVITHLEDNGNVTEIPYYASFNDIVSSQALDVSTDNGNKVFRFGDEEEEVDGDQEYGFQYEVTPATSTGYTDVYYNIFPTGWQNEIPAGSSFKITFPKAFDKDLLQIYYGRYGEQMNGKDIVSLSWNGNTVSGTLTEALPVGTGMTFYVPVEEGYFHSVHTMKGMNILFMLMSAAILLILGILFWLFGRDKMIIPSVQFRPPNGLDSAAAGYIIDGDVSDTDAVSLLLFWADKGYIKIRETEKKGLSFIKLSDLPKNVPQYEKTFFNGIFGKDAPSMKEVKMKDLRYRVSQTFFKTKEQIAAKYKGRVYTTSSRAARIAGTVLSCVPVFLFSICLVQMTFTNWLVFVLPALYFIGLLLFNYTVDYWYAKAKNPRLLMGSASVAMSVTSVLSLVFVYGMGMVRGTLLNLFPGLLAVAVVSCAGLVLTGFMKKRTDECIEWMGCLAGLREFIETAELERMEVIAKDSPHLFYHILPFAYVFGLTDVLLDKMKDLTLPSPEWYDTQTTYTYFDYYVMHRMLHTDMNQAANTISTPMPSKSSGGSGGFSGGGFSGGGFGGGGGGSW